MIGQSRAEKKQDLRHKFYQSLKRAPTEAVTSFSSTYRTLVAEMEAEGIFIQDSEKAWVYIQKLGPTELQKQLLETTCGEDPTYLSAEKESLRLFRRIHVQNRAPTGHAPSLASGRSRREFGRRFLEDLMYAKRGKVPQRAP